MSFSPIQCVPSDARLPFLFIDSLYANSNFYFLHVIGISQALTKVSHYLLSDDQMTSFIVGINRFAYFLLLIILYKIDFSLM